MPYLLALACASNVGSAATLIGNPQNMLIGEVLRLDFAGYAVRALPPVVLSLAALWAWLSAQALAAEVSRGGPSTAARLDEPAFDRWQTTKGLAVAAVLMAVFLFTPWRRDVAALVGAGVLLLSQRFHSSGVMSLVDWELLVLFIGLFVVNHALALTGLAPRALDWLAARGVALQDGVPMFAATLGLSNLVSNVPAVMLLLPAAAAAADPAATGATLALVSTLAGNLLIVGSIANIIVVDAARDYGIEIDWRRHARTGIPVATASLGLTAAWLWLAR